MSGSIRIHAYLALIAAFWVVGTSTEVCTDMPRFSTHGAVVTRCNDTIQDAIVERIRLYPQKTADSEQTIERNGILVRYPDAQATILICHGFMCDKFDVGFLRYLFPRGQFNFMTFDFRAHGENSDGQYCTFGKDEVFDVKAAAHFLRNHPELKNRPLFVYGFSMGAASSIEAQAKDSTLFDAMILDCPFDSTENIIKGCINNLKFSFFGYEFALPGKSILEKYAFHPYVQATIKVLLRAVAHMDPRNIQTDVARVSPVESAKNISVPCFFIHCKNDEKVSINAVKSIFAQTTGYKSFWLTNGRRHFDSFFYNPERYAQRITDFLDVVMKGDMPTNIAGGIFEDGDDAGEMGKSIDLLGRLK